MAGRPGTPLPSSGRRSARGPDYSPDMVRHPGSARPQSSDSNVQFLDEDQLRCLSSPPRLEVFSTLIRLGRASVAEVARTVARPPDALYYHIRQLLVCGLLRPAGQRPATTRPEQLYEPVAHLVRTDPDNDSKEYLEARKAFTASMLRAARHRLHDYLDQLTGDPRASRRRPQLHSLLVRLDERDADEFLSRLESAFSFARDRSLDDGGEFYSLLGLATPVVERGGDQDP